MRKLMEKIKGMLNIGKKDKNADTILFSGKYEDANLAVLAKIIAKDFLCRTRVRKSGMGRFIFFVGNKKNCYMADTVFAMISEYILNRCSELAQIYAETHQYNRNQVYDMTDNYMIGWIEGFDKNLKNERKKERYKNKRISMNRKYIECSNYLEDVRDLPLGIFDCNTRAYCGGFYDGEDFNIGEYIQNFMAETQ